MNMNMPTCLPDYEHGSIVNLMSSLIKAFGGTTIYQPLNWLTPEMLAEKRHVVLIVLDGFGYHSLLRQRETSIFRKYLRASLTSVFPSTTASSITSILTGLAPQQHAVTGWFMYLKEFGSVVTSLLYQDRYYFGLFEPDPRLWNRVGDYVLIMRDNYIIKEFLVNEKEKFHIGNHGGVSEAEMLVPVIIVGE